MRQSSRGPFGKRRCILLLRDNEFNFRSDTVPYRISVVFDVDTDGTLHDRIVGFCSIE